ncbi:MAG: DUF262 domain-containing protein [Planctomycetia bacterium]|nr:DUF262 domain-containing protein [Planctomycetia bacterium]
MSYIIEPMSLISFLDEGKLRLPRFQRKATWSNKQNFELSISIFQDYPIGVVIINEEEKVSWLLDGRQRRNALIAMRDNPVELYKWAQNYIKFKKTADELGIMKLYWDKVEKYLQTEERDTEKNSFDPNIYSEEAENIEDYEDIEKNSFNSTRQRKGLQTLLDIILMVHQNSPEGSKWEQIFDFTKYFDRLRYAPIKNDKKIVPILLRRFLLDLIKSIDGEYGGNLTLQNFVDYYVQNEVVRDQNNFEKDVEKKWNDINKSIDIIVRSEKIFTDARIGVIRLKNASPLDAQNIFSRINKGGTQLKAEELLSAKPYWNRIVNVTDTYIVDQIREMYSRLGLGISAPDSFVRWDLAATLIPRIDEHYLIFDSYSEIKRKKEVSMEEITLGFKLISAIYQGGMSNKHVIDLEKNESIKWGTDIDELVNDINVICKILEEDNFFKYYQSWKKPITKLLGNAIALEFITILWHNWKEKGKPRYAVSAEMKALQRDARILFDRLIFEYATKTWRGSGDSKMSNDIKYWKARIHPVDRNDWENFIQGACAGNYNGQPTTVKSLRPLLYYFYILEEKIPINQANISFDVDHIIPQEIFRGNNMIQQSLKDSLINLALLPTKENISKKSKKLNEIADKWLKFQIENYTGILEIDFNKFSDITNIESLKEHRETLFVAAFSNKRAKWLMN